MADRAITQCDGCGAYDDHPKIHIATNAENADTYHHDCMPHKIEQMVLNGAGYDGVGGVADIIDQAKSGIRGPKLLAYIEKTHEGVNQDV